SEPRCTGAPDSYFPTAFIVARPRVTYLRLLGAPVHGKQATTSYSPNVKRLPVRAEDCNRDTGMTGRNRFDRHNSVLYSPKRKQRLEQFIYLCYMLSVTEENYLKALLHITSESGTNGEAGTNQLAGKLDVRPATATDMLKRLRDKELVNYEKYGKISLTEKGRLEATHIIRKHRLWETFLFDKLGFRWDEVHDVAEQLEHVRSDKLVERLDEFLGYPSFDPHGDAIPTAQGELLDQQRQKLSLVETGHHYRVTAVNDANPQFLIYASRVGIGINTLVHVMERVAFDRSLNIRIGEKEMNVSEKVAQNVYCEKMAK